jgi:hypothetical protein
MKKLLIVLLGVVSLKGIAQTRLYFSSSESAPISPSLKGSWGYTSEMSRYKLNDVKGSSAIATGTQIGPWTSGITAIDRQYTTTRMSAGITFTASTTTYKMQLMVREFNNNDNSDRIALGIYVVSEDGTTIRATLKTLGTGTTGEFINNASYRNKSYSTSSTSIANSYTTAEGDRLVIEIGYTDNAGSTPEASAKWGENATDLPENETQTTNGAGWIQFSNNITFIGEYVPPPPPPPTTTFVCGFECGVSGPHGLLGGTASFNTNSAFTRSGNRSLRLNSSLSEATLKFPTYSSDFVLRTYIYFTALPTIDTTLFSCWASWIDELPNVAIRIPGVFFKAADSKIYASWRYPPDSWTGNEVEGDGIPITTGQWYKLDVKVSLATNPHTIEIKVNDMLTSYAGVANPSAWGMDEYYFGAAGNYDLYLDDVIVSTNLSDYPFSSGNIYPFVPTSDHTHNIAGTGDFRKTPTNTDILNTTTDAYQLIDELPVGSGGDWVNMLGPPNATDYVQFKFGPAPGITLPALAPNAVSVVCAVHQASTGAGNMEIRLNDNGTANTIYTASQVAGTTSLNYVQKYYSVAPTGGPWTVTSGAGNFNNLKIQFGSPSTVDVSPNQYFDGAIIEANFPSSTSPPPRRVRLIQ